jgi:hypothetical protein
VTLRLLCIAVLLASGCAANRGAVAQRSAKLSRAVRRGDAEDVRAMLLPATIASVDTQSLLAADGRKQRAKRLRADEVHLQATILLADGRPARLVKRKGGWFFAEDPTDVYRQETPEDAVAALVWASRRGRWDVLLRLAPRRYRVGLSEAKLEAAWTEGEGATELRAARDRVAAHLGDPIPRDAHEARLDLGDGRVLRLEREAGAWVIVDF